MTLNAGELIDVIEPVRRVVRARCSDPVLAEDLVQETLLRVAQVQRRSPPDVLEAYAIRIATNLVAGHARQAGRNERRLHRLTELDPGVTPESSAIDGEETEALAHALRRIDRDHRRILELHEVDGVDVGAIADIEEVGRSSVSMRLMRARAALRTEFVLAYRKQEIPDRCRAVLMALATGDTRRQANLDADEHVRTCDTCEALHPAIVERRRAYATTVGAFGAALVGSLHWLIRPFKGRRAQTAVVGAVAAAALATTGVIMASRQPDDGPSSGETVTTALLAPSGAPQTTAPLPAAPSQSPTVSPTAVVSGSAPASPAPGAFTIDGSAVPPVPSTGLAIRAGQIVAARGLTVEAVPADEGFWLRVSPDLRIWVRLIGRGESPLSITPGLVVDLDGLLRRHDPADVPADVAAAVADVGVYVEVRFDGVRIAA